MNSMTTNATAEIITADNTGNISLYIVPPNTPANAGPTINPRLADIDSLPKFLLLFLSVETSARYALATEILPPVTPSKVLAKKSIINGNVMINIPKMVELILIICQTGKNNAIKNIIQPANVPPLLSKRIFFLP